MCMTVRTLFPSDDMIVDRYHQHGLESNPFAASPGPQRASSVFVDRGLSDPPPPGSSTLVQVIGHRGYGKSTQVFAWQSKAPGPYHYVPRYPYRARWESPPVETLVYGDEIDRMPSVLRRRWFRQLARVGATVVIGTHVDLAARARRAGLHVVTHRFGPADLATVSALLVGRVSQARVANSAQPFQLTDDDIRAVHDASHGSLRTAEVLAHELVALRVHSHDTNVTAV